MRKMIFAFMFGMLIAANGVYARGYCWQCQNGQCRRVQTKSGYHWQCNGVTCKMVKYVKPQEETAVELPPEQADTKPSIIEDKNRQWAYTEEEECVKTEDQILDTINKERAKYNLPPLEIVQNKRSFCRLHSRRMAQQGGLFHAAGMECVAMNNTKDGTAVARQWLHSPAHRAIVMSRHTQCGIGTYRSFHTFRMYTVTTEANTATNIEVQKDGEAE